MYVTFCRSHSVKARAKIAQCEEIPLTPSLRRPVKPADWHAFRFVRVLPVAVSTCHHATHDCDKHGMTCIHAGVSRSLREHASVPPDIRHCCQ